jgi:mannosyl-3-phosphoglycerate phosphatase
MAYIVFTDLDGTLLDHEHYSYAAARPALDRLQETGTPLILASSKTACEIAALRTELGLSDYPAIVENGAGLLAANTAPPTTTETDSEYTALRTALSEFPGELRDYFLGFGDLSPEQIAALTGLSVEAARLAKIRQFSEPGLWSGDADQQQQFENQLLAKGIKCRQGGRFLTLSYGKTKADHMQQIIDQLYKSCDKPTIVALGDAPNDIEMLQAADIGIVIDNPAGTSLRGAFDEAEGKIAYSTSPGPVGWNEMVMALFDGNSAAPSTES